MKIGLWHLTLSALLLFLSAETAEGRAIGPLQSFQMERNAINKNGMPVLGSWAAGNMVAGSVGNRIPKPTQSSFISSTPSGIS